MKTISIDAPNVPMETCATHADAHLELTIDLPPEINQRDIEDLQTLAKWFKSASIEFADIDNIFSNFDELKPAFR
jgi:hypothetical protein